MVASHHRPLDRVREPNGKTNLSHDGLNPAHVPCWRVNNPTLGEFCFAMIGRADIEGSKSDVAMNAWPPQASYPCGSIGRAFAVSMRTEHRDQASFCPFALREVSVLAELALGHLRYSLTDVPPQSNSPPGSVLESDHAGVLSAIGRSLTPL
ncbi:hypothetical protein PUN28_017917 [Cardiocondyla obscurior]|uniref:Regulator of rDNA transcription protein 15 n=1 Tax=Cardiocondyla obscurior TaxID=286306 RepID=A0AAW2E4P1_9HYME